MMEVFIRQGALLLAALGVLSLALAPLLGRRWPVSVYVALDLWTAAGILDLGAGRGWQEIGGAAAIIAVRRLVGLRLHLEEKTA